jgi:hypothetical protein
MLNDDAHSDCCGSPYRLKERGPVCGVCGQPCSLVEPDTPETLEVAVEDTIKLKEHLS